MNQQLRDVIINVSFLIGALLIIGAFENSIGWFGGWALVDLLDDPKLYVGIVVIGIGVYFQLQRKADFKINIIIPSMIIGVILLFSGIAEELLLYIILGIISISFGIYFLRNKNKNPKNNSKKKGILFGGTCSYYFQEKKKDLTKGKEDKE